MIFHCCCEGFAVREHLSRDDRQLLTFAFELCHLSIDGEAGYFKPGKIQVELAQILRSNCINGGDGAEVAGLHVMDIDIEGIRHSIISAIAKAGI